LTDSSAAIPAGSPQTLWEVLSPELGTSPTSRHCSSSATASASIAKAAKDRAEAIAAGKEPKPGDGSWSAIPEGATEAYQLRWRAGRDTADTTFIPFGGPTGEDFGYLQGLLHDVPPFDKSPLVEQDRPFTGTGSTSGGIPEWIARGSNTGSDPQIWKLDRDGNAEIYAQYAPQGKSWKRTK
jgi:hypothetical protein